MLSKRILSSITTIALCISFMIPPSVFALNEITGGSDSSGATNTNIALNWQITGSGTIPVHLYVPSGTLSMTTTTGLTFTGESSGSNLYFSGSLSNVNNALATLRYLNESAGTYTIELSLVEAGQIVHPITGHVYEVIDHGSAITGANARNAALLRTYGGISGYLTNITSSEENAFVGARLGQDGWFGASDVNQEGSWEWRDGPEAGTVFWANGTSQNGAYANWAIDEPNNLGNEDCSQFYANGNGWNDLPCDSVGMNTYVVEYGSTIEGGGPTSASDSLTVTVSADTTTQAPTLTSPASDSTQNTLQLIYTLPEAPTAGSVSVVFDNGTDANTYIMGDTQSVNVPMFLYRGASFFEEPVFYSGVSEDYLLLGAGPWPGTLPDGVYTVTLSYQDSLGNTASTDVATAVTIDTTAPSAVTVTVPNPHAEIISTTSTVSGTCESGATVSISNIHLVTNPTTTVCSGGAYSTSISWLDSANNVSQTLIFKQTDGAGNIGSETTVIVDYAGQTGSRGGSFIVPEKEIEKKEIIENKKEETPAPKSSEEGHEILKEGIEIVILNAADETVCPVHTYLTNPIRFGKKNNPEDVKLLEAFLNRYENANLPIDGIYSRKDFRAVIKWQEKYAQDILTPWGLKKGTGYVYTKSLAKIKEIEEGGCGK